jgi:hypothetical protein
VYLLVIYKHRYSSVSYEPPFFRRSVKHGGRIQPRVHVSYMNITVQRKPARSALRSPLTQGVTFVILPVALYWCECGFLTLSE